MLCQFQVYSKVTQLYIYIYPFFFRYFSHIGYYRILSRVPCAIQQVLVDYLFYIQQCVYVNILLSMVIDKLYRSTGIFSEQFLMDLYKTVILDQHIKALKCYSNEIKVCMCGGVFVRCGVCVCVCVRYVWQEWAGRGWGALDAARAKSRVYKNPSCVQGTFLENKVPGLSGH